MLTDFNRKMPIAKKAWFDSLKLWLGDDWKNKRMLIPDKLEFRHMDSSKLNTKPYFIAIDTETYASNANLICMSNSENNNTLYGSAKKMPSIEEYYQYLDALQTSSNVSFICWNLGYDARIILKSLGEDLNSFYYGAEDGDRFVKTIDGLKITYLNKKCLTLSRNKHSIKIYDALQFFVGAGIKKDGTKGSSALDDVARAYKIGQKKYTGKYKNNVFPNQIPNDELALIVEYCQRDCIITKKLMDIWIDAFYSNFKFYPNAFYSAGFLTAQYFKTKLDKFPSFRFIPYVVQTQAWHSYFGGRFEIMQRGTLKDIYHYDINSAYPYAMSLMPDFNYGKWVRINTIEKWQKFKKFVGFYKIEVDVKELHLAPFLLHDKNGQVYCPRGELITNVTAKELEIADKYYDFDLKKIDGYCFIPSYEGKSDFNKLILSMYNARMKQTNEGQKYVYKVLINSGYGKFAQSKPEPKNLFNPVICSYITGFCRAMLLEACAKNKENIVMLATDGIFSTVPLKLPISKKLGEYDSEFHPKMILVMAGIYSLNTKKDTKLKTKSRGFALKVFDKNGNNEQLFNLSEYKLTLEKGNYYYQFYNRRSIAISQAIIQKKYDIKNIGKMEYIPKKIDINADRKRQWNDLLESVKGNTQSRTRII